MIPTCFASPSRLFVPGGVSVLFAGLVAVGLCSSCGGNGSGAGGSGGSGGKEEPVALLPADGTPILLKMEGNGWNFSATCVPYRAGDFSGTVQEGEMAILSLPDGAALQAEALTGTWEQGCSAVAGTIEPLLFEMEGQGADGAGVRIQMDEFCLEVESCDAAGNMSGRVRRGNLIVGRQAPLSLQGDESFTITPLR